MELLLRRCAANRNRTIGLLFVDGEFLCFTLEDRIRDAKVAGTTAIPTGKYRVQQSMSNRFGKVLPELLDVPGFAGVRIHSGNTEKDTRGCILVGMGWDGRSDSILRSREALTLLQRMLEEQCTLLVAPIEDDPDGSDV